MANSFEIAGIHGWWGNPIFIAEIGVNHNGDIKSLLALTEAASRAGADFVKTQLRTPDALFAPSARRDSDFEDVGAWLKATSLDHGAWREWRAACVELEIEPLASAWSRLDLEAVLEVINPSAVKIPSSELLNTELIGTAASTGLPMVVSTGMHTIGEVRSSIARLHASTPKAEVALLHCVSTYPVDPGRTALHRLDSLAELGLPTGYSGHELGWAPTLAAVAKGVTIVERHITLDRQASGPDHRASLEPEAFGQMVSDCRSIARSCHDRAYMPTEQVRQSELRNRVVLGSSPYALSDMAEGSLIRSGAVEFRSPMAGASVMEFMDRRGERLRQEVVAGEALTARHIGGHSRPGPQIPWLAGIRWGLPCRPADAGEVVATFEPDHLEFHLTMSDLDAHLADGGIAVEMARASSGRTISLHLPDRLTGFRPFSLGSTDTEVTAESSAAFAACLQIAQELSEKLQLEVPVVGSLLLSSEIEVAGVYQRMRSLCEPFESARVLCQTLPEVGTAFGGEFACDTFVTPVDLISWVELGGEICLDISHTALWDSAARPGSETDNVLAVLSGVEIAEIIHLSDARLPVDEGVLPGDGHLDFEHVQRAVLDSCSSTPTVVIEPWNGHSNGYEGFRAALERFGLIGDG